MYYHFKNKPIQVKIPVCLRQNQATIHSYAHTTVLVNAFLALFDDQSFLQLPSWWVRGAGVFVIRWEGDETSSAHMGGT